MASDKSKFLDLGEYLLAKAVKHSNNIVLVSRYQHSSFFDPKNLDQGSSDSEETPSSINDCLRWTYGDLLERSQRLATNLAAEGLRKGSTVISMLENGAELMLLYWACIRLGCLFYPLNPQAVKNPTLLCKSLSTTAKIGVLVAADGKMAEAIETALGENRENYKVICTSSKTADGWTSLDEIFAKDVPQPSDFTTVAVSYEDNDIILSLDTNMTSTPLAYGFTSTLTTALIESFQISRSLQKFNTTSKHFQDISAVALQNLHICQPFGIIWALGFWSIGGTIVIASKSFDASAALLAIEEEKCTHMAAIPSMVEALVKESKVLKRKVLLEEVERPFIIELSGSIITQQPNVDLCLVKLNATNVTIMNPENDLGLDRFPITSTGKVGIIEKFDLICLYKAADLKRGKSEDKLTPTEIKIRQIWATVLGMNATDIPVDRDMLDFSDSLTILTVSGLISRELDMELSSADIYFFHTIQAQAKNLDRSPNIVQPQPGPTADKPTSSPRSASAHVGPPHMFHGIPHAYYKNKSLQGEKKREFFNAEFKKTKEACNSVLNQYKLGWADVEDVLPIPPTSAYTFEHSPGDKSWICRNTLTTQRSCGEMVSAVMYVLTHRHTILRSVMVRIDTKPYHVAVRSTLPWLKQIIFMKEEVATPSELNKVSIEHHVKPRVDEDGNPSAEGVPLFQVIICHVKSTNTTGIVIIAHQSVFDSSSLSLFLEDVATYASHGKDALKANASYKLYACNYYIYQNNTISVDNSYHFSRHLIGIHKLETLLWPPTKQDTQTPIHTTTSHLTQTIHLPNLTHLRQTHSITPPILLKAAIILFNISQTGTSEALFCSTNACRKWPFFDEYTGPEKNQVWSRSASIEGPTMELFVERVKVEEGEVVREFLEGLQSTAKDNDSKFPAPYPIVHYNLVRRDAATYNKILTHQRYDWDSFLTHTAWSSPAASDPDTVTPAPPSSPSKTKTKRDPKTNPPITLSPPINPNSNPPVMLLTHTKNNAPINLCWRGALLTPEKMVLRAEYDAAQYSKEEVAAWIEEVLGAVEWLCEEGSWGVCVHDCGFEGGVALGEESLLSGLGGEEDGESLLVGVDGDEADEESEDKMFSFELDDDDEVDGEFDAEVDAEGEDEENELLGREVLSE